jgi:hypothetical protein
VPVGHSPEKNFPHENQTEMADRLTITPFYVELLESLKASIAQCGIKSVMVKQGKINFTETSLRNWYHRKRFIN